MSHPSMPPQTPPSTALQAAPQSKLLALATRFLSLGAAQRRVFLGKLREQGLDASALPIPTGVAGDRSPPSFSQQRLWFLEQLEPGNSTYHLPGALRLSGALDVDAVQLAFDHLVQRHASLRTLFATAEDGTPEQVIHTPLPVLIEQLKAADEAELHALSEAFARRPFDLAQGPLWRVALVGLPDDEQGRPQHALLVCLHHIIADGWSIQVLLLDFVQAYRARLQGEQIELAELPVSYADVALWQRACLEAGEGERQLAYWQQQLGDEPPVLELPTDRPRPARQSYRGARLTFTISDALNTRMKGLARQRGVTLFTVMLAAYEVLLQRLSGQSDLRIGVPIAGRGRAETEGLIGFFVNTQILRGEVSADSTFGQIVEQVRLASQGAQANQDLPFEQLVDVLAPERSLSHNPLFQVLYNHQQRQDDALQLMPGLDAQLMPLDSGSAQFDLALHTWETAAGELAGNWNYATDLFDHASVERLHQRFVGLLEQLLEQPGAAVGDFVLLDEEDRHQLGLVNDTARDWALDFQGNEAIVHRHFERLAALHPEREALRFGDEVVSYGELDRRANQLSHYLLNAGVSRESLVGVAALRSVEMVVALYAVVKAGAAYVPLDPEYPADRLRYMIEDAGISLLLTHDAAVDVLPSVDGVQVLNLDRLVLDDQPTQAPNVEIHPEQLAYMIYTSGSTGKPKGAGNTHAALFNRLAWMQNAYSLDASDSVLQKTPFSFDVSVWEFFWPLMTGARLVLAQPGDHRDPAVLTALIAEHQITTLHFVPSMLAAFMAQDDLSGCGSLKRIVCSGEALPADLQRETLQRLPNAGLFNLYGPTEAAIDVTHWTCRNEPGATVPIGEPIANLQIHILDSRLNPQPIGVPGELYIGGAGLARGYHLRPALTAERFVASPFGNGERLYRTGDLARWRKDGAMEYLGRLDHQIKLRGLRIEIGEIESALLDHPAVHEAVVVARQLATGMQLVGYLVAGDFDEEQLRTQLKQRLPDYMVPAHLVTLDSFPLSANGKLDRKALPEPQVQQRTFEAPQAGVESQLAGLWQDLLGVANVGRQDNFFELGGDSILSLQIISRARKLGIVLTPRQMFERQTVAELAQVAEAVIQDDSATPTRIEFNRDVPLTPIQHWFFEQPMTRRAHWNQSLLLTCNEALDVTALQRALHAVLNQHDALRMGYRQRNDGQWQQRYRAEAPAESVLWQRRVSSEQLTAACDEAQASLDLQHGPLLRAVHFTLADGSERLLLVVHHLVVDGVSWRLLLEDLNSAYVQAQAGLAIDLGEKGVSFQRWADALVQYAYSDALLLEADYWRAIPLGITPALDTVGGPGITAAPDTVGGPGMTPAPDTVGGSLLATASSQPTQHSGAEHRVASKLPPTSAHVQLDAERTHALLSEAPAAPSGITAAPDTVGGPGMTPAPDTVGGSLLATASSQPTQHSEAEHRIASKLPPTSAHVQLDAERTHALLSEAPAAYRTQINDLLLTALARALHAWSGNDRASIALEGHGREALFDGIDPSRTVGWFTSLYPVSLQAHASLDLALKHTKETLRAVPHGGLGYGLLRHLRGESLPSLDGSVLFNYMGRVQHSSGVFNLASESSGAQRASDAPLSCALSMDAQVRDGCFHLTCTYRGEQHASASIQSLLDAYVAALDELIEHCRTHSAVTPSDFPALTLDQSQLDALPLSAHIAARDIEQLYPLTPMQQGMLFHSELGQGDGANADDARDLYINQVAMDIEHLPVARFKTAWRAAVQRHPILRAAFLRLSATQQPVQLVRRDAALIVRELDLRGDPQAVSAALAAERDTPFQLHEAPLMRVLLLRVSDSGWKLVWTFHHILLDGWSSAAVLGEVIQAALSDTAPTPAGHYGDYVQWLQSRDEAASAQFWQHHLAGFDQPTMMAAALLPPTSSHGKPLPKQVRVKSMDLDSALLNGAARRQHVTANTLIQAVWVLLLQRYTGQRRVAFGATVSGRSAQVPGIERMLGLFINTLPLVQAPESQQKVGAWLNELQAHNLELREHEHTPLFEAQRFAGQAGRDLFDSLLVFENFPVDSVLRAKHAGGAGPGETRLGAVELSDKTHYPLSLAVVAGEQAHVHVNYHSNVFSAEQIERLCGHFQQLLDGICRFPEASIGELQMLTAQDRDELESWNNPPFSSYSARPIHELIADQARLRPDAIALVHGAQSLTFAKFDQRANQLAHTLRRMGVTTEVRVAIAMERGIDLWLSFFAVLKAGGAYIPLDPDYPAERLRYMLEDGGVKLLISHDAALDRVPVGDVSLLNFDRLDLSAEPITAPETIIHPQQLAYLIYTSGSTGKPKGAAIAHADISMHIQTIGERYRFTAEDRKFHFLSISFDGAHEGWMMPMCCGARVVLRDQELWSVEQTYDTLIREGITVASFPPSYLRQLSDWAGVQGKGPGVKTYCFAGEAFSREMLHDVIRNLQPETVINGYGPTETVVTPTLWLAPASTADFTTAYAPIGDLVGDRQGYVMDADLNPLPQGIAGELYLGGAVARGYLDRPGATAEKFVPHPFRAGERLYRSGDRVRLGSDGQLEYLGRIDHQIKLRGFRIEAGEIEAALKACDGVREALVIVRDGPQGKRLLGYVGGNELNEDNLKQQLKNHLPEYMVPAHIVVMERLPQLPNGKLDRNSLPEPQLGSGDYQAPQTVLEQQLATIWQQLLGIDAVGRNDHFFELGGHSLLAMQLISRLRHEHDLNVSLRALFDAPRLSDFALSMASSGPAAAQLELTARHATRAVQSFSQQRLWFLDQLQPGGHAYNLPGAIRLSGALDERALQAAFDGLASRHDVLRTGFSAGSPLPMQTVEAAGGVRIERLDLSDSTVIETDFDALAQAFVKRPFDLSRSPVWRVALVRIAEGEQRLLLCLHHMISDGGSVRVLLQEFAELYSAAVERRAPQLAELPVQYADFAVWQREWLAAGEGERQLAYWKQQLGGEQPVLELPTDRPRPAQQSYRGDRVMFSLDAALSERLRGFAKSQGVTPFMAILAAYQVLLHRLSGHNDVRVGVPIAGRSRLEVEGLIGFFVSTQVLRAELSAGHSFAQVLSQAKATTLGAQAHQDLPFEQLVEALQPQRSLSHNPLFQVAYDHQQRDYQPLSSLPGLKAEVLPLNDGSSQFDLMLNTEEDADGALTGSWTYATDVFDHSTVERLHQRFVQLFSVLLDQPDAAIGDVVLLDEQDRHQLGLVNATARDWALDLQSGEPIVHRHFERLAALHPEREALRFGDEVMSYGELDRRANQLAHYLRASNVGRESLVGVAALRSVEMVVALYAVVKAGAAYVPLDPEYPADRLRYMIEDAGISLLLTHDAAVGVLPLVDGVQVLNLDRLVLDDQPTQAPNIEIHPEQLAYMIYTSGSTGKPKGAGNTHAALINRLAWMQEAYSLDASDAVLQKTPFSFDVSVWEFFWPLMTGARLVLAQPGDHRDPAVLTSLINQHRITTLHFVPSMLAAFMAQDDVSGCGSLKRIICSGEALPADLQRDTLQRLPNAGLFNLYGPTEAAIDVTHWTCRVEPGATVPIGQPIANLRIHILDSRLNPQPIGVPGELYIGGAGLARGYHLRPALTAERFVASPFGSGERLYRTGDLARWRKDGAVEYLGRLDHQIKLRGLRIEIGEIESALLDHPAVHEVVVVARQLATGMQLVGYVVAGDFDEEQLRTQLKQRLPDYMVPAHLVALDSFPLSANGKLDRKALPEPQLQQRAFETPQVGVESQLAGLWQDLLGVEQIGRQDNFFELGGHSLLGIQLVAQVRRDLKLELPLRALFDSPVLADLAHYLNTHAEVAAMPPLLPRAESTVASRLESEGTQRGSSFAPQSFAQQRLWFLAQLEPDSAAYNLPCVLRLSGTLQIDALQRSFDALAQRHETLRTCFLPGEQGVPLQRILPNASVTITHHDLRQAQIPPSGAENTKLWEGACSRFDSSSVGDVEGADAIASKLPPTGSSHAPAANTDLLERGLPAKALGQPPHLADGRTDSRASLAPTGIEAPVVLAATLSVPEHSAIAQTPHAPAANPGLWEGACSRFDSSSIGDVEGADAIASKLPPTGSTSAEALAATLSSCRSALARDGVGSVDTEVAFAALAQTFMAEPFDLDAPRSPWRVALVRLADDQWGLLMCMHHIISDGWSVQVMLEDFAALYRAHSTGTDAQLPALAVQSADYASWQRGHLTGRERERQLSWWRAALGDEQPVLELPADRSRPAERDGKGGRHAFTLPQALADKLRVTARQQDATLFMLFLAAFDSLLYRLTGQRDLRIGVPVAGRADVQTQRLLGFFVNTLVLRAEVSGDQSFSTLLAQVKDNLLGAHAHQDLPFEQLVEALQPARSLSVNPLFQVSYNHQLQPDMSLLQFDGLTCEPQPWQIDGTQFDLVLGTFEHQDGRISGYLDYATDLFDAATVERLFGQLVTVLDAVCQQPDTAIGDLPLLTPRDLAELEAWNTPPFSAYSDRPIHELIADQARLRPDAIALVHGAQSLTFAEFDQRANQLAHALRRRGVTTEVRVAIAMERGIDLWLSFFAVLKAGGAYIPLDPDYPAERLRYMLEDGGVKLLISHDAALDRVPVGEVSLLNFDRLDLSAEPITTPETVIHPQQLAYLIYTSGSTGKPKGAAIAHADISMHIQTIGERYRFTAEDRKFHFLSISFDGAHEGWMMPMCYGARVVLRDQELWSVEQTYDTLIREGITVASFPPSYLRQLSDWAGVQGKGPGVKTYCFAGEAFSREMLHDVIRNLQPEVIINGYGPTETVVTPTLWLAPASTADFTTAYAPIGDLVGDRQGYVMDADLNPLPQGIAGELYLGGAVARGYLDRPGATAERFLPHPFRAGERLYRSGDRVRLNAEGQLEYLGRIDHQIKLRGFRIEAGEIEAALKACDGVREALVVVRDGPQGKRLLGYVGGKDLNEDSLKQQLKNHLPEYMVPAHIVVMQRLPQLPNGKLDRNALPEPQLGGNDYQAPHTEREVQLAAVWQALLGVEQISRQDSFFELGGDSIQSLAVITRLRQVGLKLAPKDVFSHPRLLDLALRLTTAEPTSEAASIDETPTGALPLTPIQAHFFEQPMLNRAHFNQALLLEVRRPVEAPLLARALNAVMRHHDALNLSFEQGQDKTWQQVYRPLSEADDALTQPWVVELEDDAQLLELCEQAQRSLDLQNGPLLRLVLAQMPQGQHLLLVAHHLVVDGVSWRVLLEDLARAYSQLASGSALSLGPKSASYQRWAQQLVSAARAPEREAEAAQWLQQVGESEWHWPVDEPQGRATQADIEQCEWLLDSELTRRLLREAPAALNARVDEILLTALVQALKAWGDLDQSLIALEGHGREALSEPPSEALDVGRTVGWFTSLFPVRLQASASIRDTLNGVRETLRALPDKGVGFGLLRYLGNDAVRQQLASLPEPKVVFNYLGQFDQALGDGRFAPSTVSAGALIDPSTPLNRELEINGQVFAGQLGLTLRFSAQRYRRDTVQRLLDAYEHALVELLESVKPVQATAPIPAVSSGTGPNPLIRLSSGATAHPPVFCVHPVSGTVVGYYALARRLSTQWDVWGLQNRQVLDAGWRDTSIEQMARDYVKAMLEQQPSGTYRLIGWSMGGTMVLEMARLLERLGKRVEFVGLIDGYVPGAGQPRPPVAQPRASVASSAVESSDDSSAAEGDEHWQQLLAVERHMRQLANQCQRILPSAAPVHAWWATRSPENNDNAPALLASGLGSAMQASVWIDADHLSIVRDQLFIHQLAESLGQVRERPQSHDFQEQEYA